LLNQQAGLQGSANPLIGRRYGYDATGRLAAVDDLRQGTTKYLYDPADRLARIEGKTPESFVHDPAGNLIGINQATGGLVQGDRLILLGDRHFAYDDAGNLIEERRGTGGQLVTRYHYDGDNRLTQADTPQGTSTYRYDPLGRRVEKNTPQGKTRFTYDGARLLTETRIQHPGQGGIESSSPNGNAGGLSPKIPSPNGDRMGGNAVELIPSPNGGGLGRGRSNSSEATTPVTTLHLFEPDSFRPLARIDRSAQGQTAVYHYHLDHLGTPREMTDTQGRIVWSATHRAHGSLALADIELIDNNLRFQGQYFDSETGLHYNLNRYYDPSTGRFIHQDPIGLEGGENLYEYAPNPVNWVDPFGLMAKNCSSKTGNSAGKPAKYGPSDPPVRLNGEWSTNDMKQALLGHPPKGLGSPDLHHADQMPGSGVHEILPDVHRGNKTLHPNIFNQGVTKEMRETERKLHWWYRAREQGADQLLPGWIYD
jgi:RHS repeat-associated protein